MIRFESLAALGRWARDQPGLASVLRRPLDEGLYMIGLALRSVSVLEIVGTALGARTLAQLLRHPGADIALYSTGSAAVVGMVLRDLARVLVVDPDDEGDEGEEDDYEDEPPVQLHASAGDVAPPRIEDVPPTPAAARRWAEQYGVAERLADPVGVLARAAYTSDEHALRILRGQGSVADALAAQPPPRPAAPGVRGGKRAPAWEAQMRDQGCATLRRAAAAYLARAAEMRVEILALRADLARRARPPTEPALVALKSDLEEARAALASSVPERALGSYRAGEVRLTFEPPRLMYHEGADLSWGVKDVMVQLALEERPLRARCSCPAGAGGECPHALAALDEALYFLNDPGPIRDRLGAMLATPAWSRFLGAFDEELARRAQPPADGEQRLAWRIAREADAVTLAPLIQKRLKGGGFSHGQRVRFDELGARRELLADPRDRRALEALTAGFDHAGRVCRALEALVGHPLVLLEGRPARVARERLRVTLETGEGGVRIAFHAGSADLPPEHLASTVGPVVVLDHAEPAALIVEPDGRARALCAAFARQPARFPEESHDDLLRALGSLQESVDLALPEGLAGEPMEGDPRPVVRLAPRPDMGDVEVALRVRPAPGGPLMRPGEGAKEVLHAFEGRRLAARRDLAREAAEAGPLRPAGEDAAAWDFLLDEEAALDLLAALREMGDRVVVEWLEPDKRLQLLGSAKAKELRVRVADRRDWFGVEGEVEVDGVAVTLATLLEAVRKGRRYVRVGPGKFAAIEEDLRRRVARAGDVLHAGRKGLEVALPGVAMLAELTTDPRQIEGASRFRDILGRLEHARTLEPALPEGLTAELRPYQAEGFRWLMRLAAWGAGACLADDMGLGKTVQALAVLLARAERGPALVVAPTSVGQNWVDEAARFAKGLRVRLYRGPGRAALLGEARAGDVLVTSYAVAVRDAGALAKMRFATLVLDEAQAIKNALTRRARAIAGLDAELSVALTGTPVENHLGELWSLMRVLTPGLLGSWDHFRDRFATPIERGRDQARSAALARVLKPFVLRRTKAEVAPELPERAEIQRMVEPSPAERRLYDAARRAALEALASGEGDARFALLAALTRLRLLACHPRLHDDGSPVASSKLAALLEIVEELREGGHRALIFSQFTSHLALVREALDARRITFAYLDGATPAEDRARRVAEFQAGGADLFLISLKAGGTGLNLTGADYVIHLDPWWNPAVEDQATDRAHRIGQTRAVTVIRLVTRGTIEEAVLALHGEKRALAASVFDGGQSPGRLSTEELADLIRTGLDSASIDEEADTGDEVVSEREPPPSSRPEPKGEVAADREASELPDAVVDYLAKLRGVRDPRHDATLQAYRRALRRFADYLAATPDAPRWRALQDADLEAYLAAVDAGRWAIPPSQRALARTVIAHLRACLRARGSPATVGG